MKKSYLKYVGGLLLFGTNGIVASHIALDSYEIVFLRTMLGSIFLLLMFFLARKKAVCFSHKRSFVFILVSGAAMGVSWLFLYEAYVLIGVGVSSLLYYCGPVIVMALSPVLFQEKLTTSKVIGFAVVLLGVLLVNGQSAGNLDMWGIFCGVMSAVLYAVMVVFNKKAKSIDGIENSLIQFASSFLVSALFVGLKSGYAVPIALGDWLWIVILGIVNTGIGGYLYFSSIGKLPVQTVAICGYLEPLSAVVFSVLLLGEGMTPLQMMGAVCILGGAVAGESIGWCRKPKRQYQIQK